MANTTRNRLVLYAALLLSSYAVSAVAWWSRNHVLFSNQTDERLAAFLIWVTIPGWLVVGMLKKDDLGTPLTDILIPVLSGLFWGTLGIGAYVLVARLRRSRTQSSR